MTRRGAALLMVLWFLVLASGLALTMVADARAGLDRSANRIGAMEGRWAAEGCLAMLRAGYGARHILAGLDSIVLGEGVWCRAEIEDPGAFLDVNTATLPELGALLGDDSLAAAIRDWVDPDAETAPLGAEREWYAERHLPLPPDRPIVDLGELGGVRGMRPELLASLADRLTAVGTGRVNVNAASAEVLAALPGIPRSYADEIVARRRTGNLLTGLDELIARAPPTARGDMRDAYVELNRQTVFAPERYVVRLSGYVGGRPLATETVTLVPAGNRVAIVRRELW